MVLSPPRGNSSYIPALHLHSTIIQIQECKAMKCTLHMHIPCTCTIVIYILVYFKWIEVEVGGAWSEKSVYLLWRSQHSISLLNLFHLYNKVHVHIGACVRSVMWVSHWPLTPHIIPLTSVKNVSRALDSSTPLLLVVIIPAVLYIWSAIEDACVSSKGRSLR